MFLFMCHPCGRKPENIEETHLSDVLTTWPSQNVIKNMHVQLAHTSYKIYVAHVKLRSQTSVNNMCLYGVQLF